MGLAAADNVARGSIVFTQSAGSIIGAETANPPMAFAAALAPDLSTK
jgi:hypothetical protein